MAIKIDNQTKFLSARGLRKLLNHHLKELGLIPSRMNGRVVFKHKDNMRYGVRFNTFGHGSYCSAVIYIRNITAAKPLSPDLPDLVDRGVWTALVRATKAYSDHVPFPDLNELLAELSPARKASQAKPLQEKRAERAQASFQKCVVEIEKTEKRLKQLGKRKKLLFQKVKYYEKALAKRTDTEQFKDKLKDLVKDKWGSNE